MSLWLSLLLVRCTSYISPVEYFIDHNVIKLNSQRTSWKCTWNALRFGTYNVDSRNFDDFLIMIVAFWFVYSCESFLLRKVYNCSSLRAIKMHTIFCFYCNKTTTCNSVFVAKICGSLNVALTCHETKI